MSRILPLERDVPGPPEKAAEDLARFRAFFALSSEGIWRCDLDEPIVLEGTPEEEIIRQMFARSYVAECNDAMARMYGYERGSELVGRRLSEMHDVTDVRSIELHRAFLRAGLRLENVESYELDRDGRPKVFINTSVGIVEGGRLVATWGTQRDVTEQRAAERRFQTIFQMTQDAILITDDEARYVEANPAACKMLGYTREEMLSRTVWDVTPVPPGVDAMAAWRGFIALGAREGEHELVHRDGRVVIVEYRAVANYLPGLHLSVLRDITERKRATARLQGLYAVTAGLAEAITMADVTRVTVEQGIEAVGASAGSLCLLTEDGRELEMVGSIGYPADAIARWGRIPMDARLPLTEAVAKGQTILLNSSAERLERYPLLAGLQSTVPTERSACVPVAIGGRALGVLGLSWGSLGPFSEADGHQIAALARQCAQAVERVRLLEAERSARSAAEAATREAEQSAREAEHSAREAERANKAKDDFLAVLSHELRTPLTPVLLSVSLMEVHPRLPGELRQDLQAIRRNVELESRLISDLLDVTRIARGKLDVHMAPADLHDIVRSAVGVCRREEAAAEVVLELGAEPAAIMGDAARLQQVVWNLVHNAQKFTPPTGRIIVRTQRAAGELVLTVSDNGIGISPEFQKRLFKAFEQADQGTTRRHGGLGLGLAICKQIVEMHGGRISASSAGVGQGTEFRVVLPTK